MCFLFTWLSGTYQHANASCGSRVSTHTPKIFRISSNDVQNHQFRVLFWSKIKKIPSAHPTKIITLDTTLANTYIVLVCMIMQQFRWKSMPIYLGACSRQLSTLTWFEPYVAFRFHLANVFLCLLGVQLVICALFIHILYCTTCTLARQFFVLTLQYNLQLTILIIYIPFINS